MSACGRRRVGGKSSHSFPAAALGGERGVIRFIFEGFFAVYAGFDALITDPPGEAGDWLGGSLSYHVYERGGDVAFQAFRIRSTAHGVFTDEHHGLRVHTTSGVDGIDGVGGKDAGTDRGATTHEPVDEAWAGGFGIDGDAGGSVRVLPDAGPIAGAC